MRGRRRGIGSYTLGDQYISPDRRMSQMLMEGSTRKGKPAHHYSDTLGRIAQQLAGGYLAGRDQKNQNVANQAFTKAEPDSYSMQPTMNDQQIMESDSVQNILRQNTDADRMKNPMIQRNMNAIGMEQKAFNQDEARLNSLDPNNFMTPDMYNTEVKTLNDAMGRATQNIENYGDEFNQTMGRLNSQEPTDDQRADAVGRELLGQRKASEVNTLNEKKPQLEYAMQNLRGLENNPYAQRLLQGLMMNQMNTDAASRLDATARERQLADATTAYGRKKELGQMPMSSEQFEQKQSLVKPTRPQFITTAEGVYSVNADGSMGTRMGSAPSQFGYTQGNVPASEQPQQAGGIPTGSTPWAGLPIKEQAKMQQSSYKEAAKMLEKNRQSLVSNKTMSDSFKRFAYLNAKQDKEAEKDYFGTKTGSFIDRMPLGGLMTLDDDKREMEKISSLLTPQMRQGMPGAASDRDVAMFANATVGIDTPKGINDSLIAGMNARFENANDRQAFMEEFLTQNKHLNGAEQEWRGYLETNPIFDPDPALEGQYVLNKNRMGYKEHFSGGGTQGRRQGDGKSRRSSDTLSSSEASELAQLKKELNK